MDQSDRHAREKPAEGELIGNVYNIYLHQRSCAVIIARFGPFQGLLSGPFPPKHKKHMVLTPPLPPPLKIGEGAPRDRSFLYSLFLVGMRHESALYFLGRVAEFLLIFVEDAPCGCSSNLRALSLFALFDCFVIILFSGRVWLCRR